jgi:pyruvate dehydrogenase E2 component (dihydrolipoamide acetyltransferase)
LPDIGEGLTEAEVIRWHVAVGDQVALDQTLVEVETDKAVVELPSPLPGTVLFRGPAEGEVLPVGEVVVVLGEPGERWPPAADGERPATPAPRVDAPIVGSLSDEAEDLTPPNGPAATVPPRPLALPPVRMLAKRLGVDLHTVTGTGPRGSITRADVTAAAESATTSPAPAPAPPATDGDERRPLSKLRRTIAANLSRAWSEVPLVTAFDEVDATRLLAARSALAGRDGVAVPIDALLVAAVLPALRAYPEFNSSLDGDMLVIHRRHDIGIALDTPDGLLVGVIADAGSRSPAELGREVRRLGEAARGRTLRAEELSGQTFTVSNIGAVGGGYGTPLVPMGTVGILSVGRVAPRPVARGSAVAVAPVMPLSLSYDHRVIDGALGRRFLAMVIEHLSEPVLFLT